MTTILSREYDGESLCDLERDVSEAFDPSLNHRVMDIPVDEHGFQKGMFTVTITWEED